MSPSWTLHPPAADLAAEDDESGPLAFDNGVDSRAAPQAAGAAAWETRGHGEPACSPALQVVHGRSDTAGRATAAAIAAELARATPDGAAADGTSITGAAAAAPGLPSFVHHLSPARDLSTTDERLESLVVVGQRVGQRVEPLHRLLRPVEPHFDPDAGDRDPLGQTRPVSRRGFRRGASRGSR